MLEATSRATGPLPGVRLKQLPGFGLDQHDDGRGPLPVRGPPRTEGRSSSGALRRCTAWQIERSGRLHCGSQRSELVRDRKPAAGSMDHGGPGHRPSGLAHRSQPAARVGRVPRRDPYRRCVARSSARSAHGEEESVSNSERRSPPLPPAGAPGVARPAQRVRGAGPAAGGVRGGSEPGPGPARRGGGRQDGAAGVRCASARPGAAIARAAGVESEMELAFAGLHQLCAPLLDGLERLPGPQRDALRHGVRPERRGAAGSLPGRPGRAEPAGRGGRGAAAGLRGRRRAVARSGLGAGARVRRAAAAGGVGRAGVRGARAERRAGAGRAAGAAWSGAGRRRCPRAAGLGDPRAGWTSGCATGSSPRRAATRWRCWSCRGG